MKETLKEATFKKHKEAERMPFNVKMFKGELSEEEYLSHLNQQLAIFDSIEKLGLPDQSLSRIKPVQEDIDELKAKGFTSNKILKSTQEYCNYISSLNKDTVMPHIYLNYLAIMFGGQMMKSKVPSTGKMYDFEDSKKAMAAIRVFQKDEWADEVNKGYEHIISIFRELEEETV
ncbi:MAG: hypothetical protein CR982_02640 [Candidatus Cloacimonadota bacterium]|nr:MAG: hypothetical protein CR982_02640 [Candidatus Cloacimonadota bacterium]PIE79327.1 MAG: hypothetical protein CSA15_03495 [Candidatus Delongbacteria bacterium]